MLFAVAPDVAEVKLILPRVEVIVPPPLILRLNPAALLAVMFPVLAVKVPAFVILNALVAGPFKVIAVPETAAAAAVVKADWLSTSAPVAVRLPFRVSVDGVVNVTAAPFETPNAMLPVSVMVTLPVVVKVEVLAFVLDTRIAPVPPFNVSELVLSKPPLEVTPVAPSSVVLPVLVRAA